MSEAAQRDGTPWYAAAYNRLGATAAALGLRRDDDFRPEALRQSARRRVLGAYDFGEPALASALNRLSADFLAHSDASQTGRTAMREHLLELLAGRLRLARRWHQDPVDGEPLHRPVFIFGLPRTGTTLLHNLIAQDPHVRVPWTFEVMMPTPQPGALSAGARRAAVAKRLDWVHRLAPAFRSVHEVSATLPQECIAITAYALQSIEFHTTHRVPAYQDWLEGSDQTPAYRFHRRFLQHLQHDDRRSAERAQGGFSPRPWVLKAPGHLFALDALLATYPDAVLVQTHRDPLEVVASISSHGVILRRAFSERVDEREVAADWSARWGRALGRTLAMRRADEALDRRILDLRYARLLAEPLEVVAELYAHAERELTPTARQRMQRFLEANPQGRHGRHRYSLEAFGLDRDSEAERYAAYRAWLNL